LEVAEEQSEAVELAGESKLGSGCIQGFGVLALT